MASIDLLAVHERARRVPLGRAALSRAYRIAAPYFVTIPADLAELRPGHGRATMRPVPWTRNHLGGVHAIAQCNLAEFVMGAVAEATVPETHRWIPRGMTVEYRRIARGPLQATAELVLPDPLPAKQELAVAIAITDREGRVVTDGEIRIWVTERPAG
jgi:acyl-coenzyme A thioesterase PaaI-like protein